MHLVYEFLVLLVLQLQTHEVCEVCAKVLFQVELARASVDQMWGFSVEAELVVDGQRQDELCCYISRVEDISLAGKTGTQSKNMPFTFELFLYLS